MKILVLNCGSSSIKYQLLDMQEETMLVGGLVDSVGLTNSFIKHEKCGSDKIKIEKSIENHTQGIEEILSLIKDPKHGCIKNLTELEAVGHRVVHGGEKFSSSVLINDEVVQMIETNSDLAPLHNPQNLKGIYAIKKLLPEIPQVAVFDTAFHQSMPDYAYIYPIPYSYYEKYQVRRYGFHGTSHKFVHQKACELLNLSKDNSKVITCHIGNGASITAIKNGKSVDTSMGLTPVEGLMMGTRCGDLDLGAIFYIMNQENLSIAEANTLINKKSGLLGVSEVSSDMRDVESAAWEKNDKKALLALDVYSYKIVKYIGSYIAAMNGVDAIVFTGGVGENGCNIRKEVCKSFSYVGLKIDEDTNDGLRGKTKCISTNDSKVKVAVITTNEELVIARDTLEIVSKK